MNAFGEFLYTLRKEKGMTQAELASALNVTNKAVSKWETGEAMPETSLLLPIAKIFNVTVDELLKGERSENSKPEEESCGEGSDLREEIKSHLFTRGKDEPKHFSEKICGAICGVLMLVGTTVYLFLGALASLWNPYWIIIPMCALACGITGIICDMCNPIKRVQKAERGENPYIGGACGIIMLTSCAAYLLVGVLTGLWHPLWVIVIAGTLVCTVVGSVGGVFSNRKK